jgi:hypothetical protein
MQHDQANTEQARRQSAQLVSMATLFSQVKSRGGGGSVARGSAVRLPSPSAAAVPAPVLDNARNRPAAADTPLGSAYDAADGDGDDDFYENNDYDYDNDGNEGE